MKIATYNVNGVNGRLPVVVYCKKSNCPEKLESPGHKNGHSESRPQLKLVAGFDVNF